MSDEEQCGAETTGDAPCQNPATNGDACWIPSHSDPDAENPQGRDFTITEDDHEDILEAAREGLSERGCARAAGTNWPQLNRYLEAHDSFRSSFARARNVGERGLVSDGLRDPDTDSSMAKFLLASSFDYVKEEKQQHEHSGEVDGFNFVINAGDDS